MFQKTMTINNDTISELLEHINISTIPDFSITIDDITHNYAINKNLLADIVLSRFMYYSFTPYHQYYNDDTKTVGENFVALFKIYLTTNARNYASILYDSFREYIPIDNYNKISEINVAVDGTVTMTPTGARKTTSNNGAHEDTTTEKDRTMENTGSVETVETKNNYGTKVDTVTEEFENRKDTTKDNTTTTTTEHTHGNIGVTQTVDMLLNEQKYRLNNIMEMIITDICNKFLYLNYGGC